MGWAKYKEDDEEIISERLEEKHSIPETQKQIVYCCQYCLSCFKSQEEMYKHINNKHGHYGALIVLNNKIALENNYVNLINSVIIYKYDLDLNITINGNLLNLENQKIEINVTGLIEKYLLEFDVVEINIGEKKWYINKFAKSNINNEKINENVKRWNKITSEGLHISKDYDKNLNPVERKCLDGLYNYFIACVSSNECDKIKRYSEARTILSEFVDLIPIARFIVIIISIKMNWIYSLRDLCIKQDYLYQVYMFLSNQEIDKFKLDDSGIKVYVEDSIEEIISAIIDFLNHKYDKVNDYLNKYSNEKLNLMSDTNLKDKIYLLKARMYLLNKDIHRAKRVYDEIQSPFFENEKKNFMAKYY